MHSWALVFIVVNCRTKCYIYGQQFPSFFDKRDLKDHGFLSAYRNPNPVPHYYDTKQTPSQLRQSISEIGHGSNEDLAQLAERLTKADKWEEFISETDRLKEEYEGRVMPNWEKDRAKWAKYSKGLQQEYIPNPLEPQGVNRTPPAQHGIPSVGMESYWGEEDIDKEITQYKNYGVQKPDPPRNIPRPSGFRQPISGKQVMEIARQKLSTLKTPDTNGYYYNVSHDRKMPTADDFGSPVRWVPYNSNDTEDGLAKVTDISTGMNQQFLINGVIFVPIIDTNILRLGYSTESPTTEAIVGITPDTSAVGIVANSVDLKSVDNRDWLAFETVLNEKHLEEQCFGDGCQARCLKTECESKCAGDTCTSGCVGSSCTAYCKGPGCFAMCIGEQCEARCDGMSCEARCRGNNCESRCQRFSCQYTVNGYFRIGSGTWDQMYSQYDTRLHEPSPGSDYIQSDTRYSPRA